MDSATLVTTLHGLLSALIITTTLKARGGTSIETTTGGVLMARAAGTVLVLTLNCARARGILLDCVYAATLGLTHTCNQ
jgi:hypothetical protein